MQTNVDARACSRAKKGSVVAYDRPIPHVFSWLVASMKTEARMLVLHLRNATIIAGVTFVLTSCTHAEQGSVGIAPSPSSAASVAPSQAYKGWPSKAAYEANKRSMPHVVRLWPHFLLPTANDYMQQHLAVKFQQIINGVVARLPTEERRYARWAPWDGKVVVFEIKRSQIRSDGRGYSPSPVINEPNLFVDPTNGNIFAGPP